ncbi:uncharacterized protein [Elaeis guineensis]|uniref:uncharacterized protein n=1 Tax=Elaeis guineensis var. tenera TaxID=51953 RepID=UPI003C6DAF18
MFSSRKSARRQEMTKERAVRRLGAVEVGSDRLVIRLPGPQFLRLLARSVLLALVIMSFPWLQAALLRQASAAESVAPLAAVPPIDDDVFVLPMLLGDLRLRGLLRPEHRAVFLGDPGVHLPYLTHNGIEAISHDRMPAFPDGSVDFVISADEVLAAAGRAGFDFIDQALKINGVAVVRVTSDPLEPFRLPENYRMAYLRRIGAATMVAMRKKSAAAAPETDVYDREAQVVQRRRGRRLLAVPEARKEALNGLEGVLLEPPRTSRRQPPLRPRYLPELTGDSLAGYPRRVFVDVGPAGAKAGAAAAWFERQYPKGDRDFEIIRVEVAAGEAEAAAAGGEGGMADWLERNVREEEYVVMKAEAGVVEEVVKGRAIGLVDELFLECDHQWEKKKGRKEMRSRRAYWECLALYGKLRDEGVAVHQWFG